MNKSITAKGLIWLVLSCFIGWILFYSFHQIMNPLMPTLKMQFGVNNTQIGLAGSAFFLTYTLIQIPAGIVSDKIGSGLLLFLSFLGFGITSLLLGLCQGFLLFILLRLAAGLFAGFYYGPQYSLSSSLLTSKYKTLGNAIINSGMAFGLSLGYLVATNFILVGHHSWHTPFLILAVPAFGLGLSFWFIAKRYEGKKRDSLVNRSQKLTSAQPIYKNKLLLSAFFVNFCSIYAYFVVITWLPEFLVSERHMSTGISGLVACIVPWVSIPAAISISHISDHIFTKSFYFKLLMPLSALSLLIVANSQQHWILYAGLILYGITGKLTIDPLVISFTGDHTDSANLSTTLSALNFVGMLGSILAPSVTGLFADIFGTMKVGFYFGAILLVLGLANFSFQYWRERKRQTQGQLAAIK